jgi:DNA ligase-associated metallophosphoesterase
MTVRMVESVGFVPRCWRGAADAALAEVVLLPHRAVYWPAARTLLVADLHWGKCETFRAHGAPLPQGILQADLRRLSAALEATGAERVVVLGDVLHAAAGITEWMVETVGAWRAERASLALVAVPGNHDRRIWVVADAWGLQVTGPQVREGPFVFQHDPLDPVGPEHAGCYTWAGHVHPAVNLRGRSDHLRLPCFWLRDRMGVLPAFSLFTGGAAIDVGDGDEVYAIGDGRVVRA